jgi:hypothetical protein
MRTYRTGRPKPRLEEGMRRILVVEVGFGKHRSPEHRVFSLEEQPSEKV